jgi:hypothetical protein
MVEEGYEVTWRRDPHAAYLSCGSVQDLACGVLQLHAVLDTPDQGESLA